MILTEEVSRRNLQREKETTRAKDREEETGEEMGRPRERSTIVETDSPGAKESQGRVGRTMTSKEHRAGGRRNLQDYREAPGLMALGS